MKKIPTRFDGYYVSEDGKVYTEWHKIYVKGISGCSTLRGNLKEIKQIPRGGTNPKDRYLAINISLKNETGKTIKQIKYYTHRLIAETLIENPNNYSEVDHIDENKSNNHISNLRWISRKHNMRHAAKEFLIEDVSNGKVYSGNNLRDWVIENWDWISKRTKVKTVKTFCNQYYQGREMKKVGLKLISFYQIT